MELTKYLGILCRRNHVSDADPTKSQRYIKSRYCVKCMAIYKSNAKIDREKHKLTVRAWRAKKRKDKRRKDKI